MPAIAARIAGGRAAPGGSVTLEAVLTDEAGRGARGSVAAVVIDKFGGGSFGALDGMDTRTGLCRALGATPERCSEALRADAGELHRRILLQDRGASPLAPSVDPAATLDDDLNEVFRRVVRSLEGGVYQASMSPETLGDVRRTAGGKHTFNPEVMTLVTESMDPAPVLPGGETVALADLIAIDPQITFDNVAKRVTRLKLFQVLAAVREFRAQEDVDPDEPILAEPNVLLRKLVREERLDEALLLDPWGGHISFFKTGGEHVPFVTVSRGWELRSPGPDGRLGTGDDVKSPFERVLRSGTPYAKAVSEDTVVDARFDMRVADATVEAWRTTLLNATGTMWGDAIGGGFGAGGLGLGGVGTAGGGRGEGMGLGRISFGVAKGVAFVAAPVRTDDQGRARIEIPLGDVETTWRVAVVGIPDAGRTAVTHVDVPVTIPLSAKVFAGASWTEGDSAEAAISVRNRTDADLAVAVEVTAEGAFSAGKSAPLSVRVAKRGVAVVRVPVSAPRAGRGALRVRASASGLPEDVLRHEVEVLPRGETVRIARAAWVGPASEVDLGPYLAREGLVAAGLAALVLERGANVVLEAALDSLAPEGIASQGALVEAAVAAALVRDHVIQREGDAAPLAKRATQLGRFAAGKLVSLAQSRKSESATVLERIRTTGLLEADEMPAVPDCPEAESALSVRAALTGLEGEPLARGGAVASCWTQFAARAFDVVDDVKDPAVVARAALALARRPHRSAETAALGRKLVALVEPTPAGLVTMPDAATRADRSMVYAALLVAGSRPEAERHLLVAWLLVQRDTRGSFGSASATRAAVQALVHVGASIDPGSGDARVRVDFGEDLAPADVALAAGGRAKLPVPQGAERLVVAPERGGLVARLERDFLRPFDVAPPPSPSGLVLRVAWPASPAVGRVSNVEISLEGAADEQPVEVKVPLPPGAALAERIDGVRQVQGALYLRASVGRKKSVFVPVRFGLAGRVTVREATAAPLEADAPPAYARARPLAVAAAR